MSVGIWTPNPRPRRPCSHGARLTVWRIQRLVRYLAAPKRRDLNACLDIEMRIRSRAIRWPRCRGKPAAPVGQRLDRTCQPAALCCGTRTAV